MNRVSVKSSLQVHPHLWGAQPGGHVAKMAANSATAHSCFNDSLHSSSADYIIAWLAKTIVRSHSQHDCHIDIINHKVTSGDNDSSWCS